MANYQSLLRTATASFALVSALSACNKLSEDTKPAAAPVASTAPATVPVISAQENGSDATKDIVHTGDLTLRNVAAGVKVTVKEGGLRITGTVGDKAQLDQQGGGGTNIVINGNGSVVQSSRSGGNIYVGGNGGSVTMSGGSISISGGNKIIVNGVDMTEQVEKAQGAVPKSVIDGIDIQGAAGSQVTIQSTSNIKMKSVGAGSYVHAGNGLIMTNAGRDSTLVAGNGANVGIIGEGTKLTAGNGINATGFCARSFISAGNSIQAQFADSKARVSSGNGAQIAGADVVGCDLK